MPILHIKALPQKSSHLIAVATKEVTQAIANRYGCRQEQVWVTWQELSPGHYFEGEKAELEQPLKTHPPICTLTCFEGKTRAEIETLLLEVATVLGAALDLDNNIFIQYQEAKAGQVVAGNGIVRNK